MVKDATKNEFAKITVHLYKADTVKHATMNKLVKITDTIFAWHVQCTLSTIQMKTD